jgi:hypothetical protein
MVSHSEIIQVPIEKVWEHFIYKIENPQHFVPGVSNVVIHEKTSDHVLRSMDVTNPAGAKSALVEKITSAPYWVKFLIVDHPMYEGHVDNLAEKISDTETRITYSIHWTNKQTGETFANVDMPKMAVLKTVDYIMNNK